MPKAKPSIVIEINQFSGLRLTDRQIASLEGLLAEVGTAVAVRFLSRGGTGEQLEARLQAETHRLTEVLEQSASRAKARRELVEAAACIIGMVLADEPPASVAPAARAA